MIWINFIIYEINIVIITIGFSLSLTPKKSLRSTVLIILGAVLIPGMIKYFVPADGSISILLAVINNVILLICVFTLFQESKLKCIFVWAMVNIINAFASGLSILVVDIDWTRDNPQTLIPELIAILLMILLQSVFVCICKKKVPLFMDRKSIFVIICLYLNYMLTAYTRIGCDFNLMEKIIDICAFVLFISFTWIMHMRARDRERQIRIAELDKMRELEQVEYDEMLGRIDRMAKIRHDFYDQVAAATYALGKDKSTGLAMIKELEKELSRQ